VRVPLIEHPSEKFLSQLEAAAVGSSYSTTRQVRVLLIEHPSEIFLFQLEAAPLRLIIQHDKTGESPAHSASQ
jgi:hypothetical protein